jgi:two-component system sensor histidine kinase AlgZ
MGHDAGERRRQNFRTLLLPDFCNLGTWLRVLVAVNGMALLASVAGNRQPGNWLGAFVEMTPYLEPITLGSLILLCASRRWLTRLPPQVQAVSAISIALVLATLFASLVAPLAGEQQSYAWIWFWTALISVVLLVWFDLAARAHAPALAEARLMALTARIRPHFLFNSLNAVLGVIRSDPRRAETALEELAELFRALMQENRDLVPMSAEISLSRQYLDLERLRLGERLQVRWDVESCPPDALVPPLMLQPLLENAVYHGIEPLGVPGEIQVLLTRHQDRLAIEIVNPCDDTGASGRHAGNRMALDNIRERLTLFFDLEATLATRIAEGRHHVRIELPYRRGEGA